MWNKFNTFLLYVVVTVMIVAVIGGVTLYQDHREMVWAFIRLPQRMQKLEDLINRLPIRPFREGEETL